ncbi:MAG: hypothetical protein FWG77_09745 [Treponema sp.]|nr:hypothetical protein [Treponema sp.]
MKFYRLSAAFYEQFSKYEEILTNENRPYYVLLLELDNLTYAIPLRSNINHRYCFIADNSNEMNKGLDYSKAVVVTEPEHIDTNPVTIRQNEYKIYIKREFLIKRQFSSYVSRYKKEIKRRADNPSLPVSSLCLYSSLKYFHNVLGLPDPENNAGQL